MEGKDPDSHTSVARTVGGKDREDMAMLLQLDLRAREGCRNSGGDEGCRGS